ncbi:mannosyltransferase [Coniochaeta ligniaria NRRL 30616]|uniref:GPI mannosyltransferase 2 n=1 Tax=Coniochaeta ligniaria NRRL 30616 TaxID=1408157 RepID=A0A1J7JA28_9PEZI|nr:mannosyltransferase [Coniochaeta ligniaria NRRL 30616]
MLAHLAHDAVRRPVPTLLTVFAAWKLFLLLIAVGSTVGPAYDTSGSITLDAASTSNGSAPALLARLTSWDAIYYTQVARRGYLFEQEWAFGSGITIVIERLVKILTSLGIQNGGHLESAAGVLVAHASHLLSALVLNNLGQLVLGDNKLALVGALLHIFSPAGLFLSAPYAEASFALLSFSGYLLYAKSCLAQRAVTRDAQIILSGALFGLATTFRSNGISHGVPFAWEFVQQLRTLPRRPVSALHQLIVLGIGGLCVAAGSIVPQFIAYRRFCDPSVLTQRPWCHGRLRSIYAFVQVHYWDNGMFRYWKVSNIPLFLLAAPMLYVLARSGMAQLGSQARTANARSDRLVGLVKSAAAAQVLITVLTLTGSHVQIITRMASGYPLWYWWLAGQLSRGDKPVAQGGFPSSGFVMFMVMYAAIQAVLFASFLPPA